jgi:hypothetical protein
MPSSFEHCSVCPFAAVAAGSEEIEYMEQALVQEHLIMLSIEEKGHRIDFSDEVSSSRILAARSCAKMIQERRCRQFYSLNMHKMENNGETVMIVRRGDAEE